MTLETRTQSRAGTDSKLKTLQSKLIQELACEAVSCIKIRMKKQKSTLEFRHFIMDCDKLWMVVTFWILNLM